MNLLISGNQSHQCYQCPILFSSLPRPTKNELSLIPLERVVAFRQAQPQARNFVNGLLRRQAAFNQAARDNSASPPVSAPAVQVRRQLPRDPVVDQRQDFAHPRGRRGRAIADRSVDPFDLRLARGGQFLQPRQVWFELHCSVAFLIRLHQRDDSPQAAIEQAVEFLVAIFLIHCPWILPSTEQAWLDPIRLREGFVRHAER